MKKFISLLLAALLLVSAVPIALATNDYTQGTQVIYTANGSESYTITVPALLAPGSNGTVTLNGTWAENRTITVTAEPTVTLTNSIKADDQKVLDVTFAGISEAGSNTGSQTFTESVSVADITNALFGTWNGKFNYNVEIVGSRAKFGEHYVTTYHLEGEYDDIVGGRYFADGSAIMDIADGSQQTLPAGFVTFPTEYEIVDSLNGIVYVISEDGNIINGYYQGDDTLLVTFQLESTIPAPTLITFTIEDTEYQAEEGMTWGEWIGSEYHYDQDEFEIIIENGVPKNLGERIYDETKSWVSADDEIIDGKNYQIGLSF